eukprot:1354868-Amorphochlora_amoeboformis.AAC.1
MRHRNAIGESGIRWNPGIYWNGIKIAEILSRSHIDGGCWRVRERRRRGEKARRADLRGETALLSLEDRTGLQSKRENSAKKIVFPAYLHGQSCAKQRVECSPELVYLRGGQRMGREDEGSGMGGIFLDFGFLWGVTV